MNSELEKIDILRARLGVGYKEAKNALDTAGGDLVQALINFEEKENTIYERFQARSQETIEQLKSLLHKGQNYKIKVKKGDDTVVEIPASVGALGLIGALASSEIAILGALGTITAMANKYTLKFEHRVDEPLSETPDREGL